VAVIAVVVLATAVRLGPLQRGLGFDELFTAIHFVQTDTIWAAGDHLGDVQQSRAYSLLARCSLA